MSRQPDRSEVAPDVALQMSPIGRRAPPSAPPAAEIQTAAAAALSAESTMEVCNSTRRRAGFLSAPAGFRDRVLFTARRCPLKIRAKRKAAREKTFEETSDYCGDCKAVDS